jgi:putative endonuclease
MMAIQKNGTLYIGITNNLSRRVYEHKTKQAKGFTAKYNVNMLVWYEHYNDVYNAITREKQLKRWERAWKIKLILEMNPDWNDLYEDLNN